MKNESRKLFNRIDFWIIATLLVLSLGIYIWHAAIFQQQGGFVYAQIIIDGEIVYVVDLSADRIFLPNQLPNVSFQIIDNTIAFVKSDCPDQICVNNGFLSTPGQVSVCLPNFTSLIIRATEGGDIIDIIAY